MASNQLTDLIVTDARSGAVQFRAYRIEVVAGPDAGKAIHVERGSVVVGTAQDADLQLTDGAVSRAHVRIAPLSDGLDVTDLGSKNGTYAAGARLMHARLAPGAELTVGRTTIRLSPEDRDAGIEPSEATNFELVHGGSRPMRQLYAILELVAPKEVPVLFEGEPGVGKQRAALSVHRKSARAQGHMHVIQGADIPEGADVLPDGLPTNAGTILIKDVDALSLASQRALVRTLETGDVDARFLATTRKDLDREAAAGRFERALLLRLGVVRARVPPLRERASDLPALISDILAELGHPAFELGPADLGRMQAYAWPDNVRELRSVIERAVSLESRPSAAVGDERDRSPSNATDQVVGGELPYKQARAHMIEAFEKEYVRGLLSRHDGNVSKAARAAGIDRVYLHRLIRKYDL